MDRRHFSRLLAFAAASGSIHAQGAYRTTSLALVLGGGGCRGYGHLGVLRALKQLGVVPDLVVGSSVGSLVGGLYAAGADFSGFERFGNDFAPNLLRSWVFSGLGLLSGDRIRRFVVDRVGEQRIEALPIRFAAIATDLRTGELVLIDKGDLGLAIQAASTAPGLMQPVRIGSRLCVDGNLASPVPVDAARRLGAVRVIAVDVSFPPAEAQLDDPLDALYQGFSILTRKLALDERARADLLIAPDIPPHNDMSRETLRSLIEAGERATDKLAPEIRRLKDKS